MANCYWEQSADFSVANIANYNPTPQNGDTLVFDSAHPGFGSAPMSGSILDLGVAIAGSVWTGVSTYSASLIVGDNAVMTGCVFYINSFEGLYFGSNCNTVDTYVAVSDAATFTSGSGNHLRLIVEATSDTPTVSLGPGTYTNCSFQYSPLSVGGFSIAGASVFIGSPVLPASVSYSGLVFINVGADCIVDYATLIGSYIGSFGTGLKLRLVEGGVTYDVLLSSPGIAPPESVQSGVTNLGVAGTMAALAASGGVLRMGL